MFVHRHTRLLPDDEDVDPASPSTPHAPAPAQEEEEGEEAEQQGEAAELSSASPPPSRLALTSWWELTALSFILAGRALLPKKPPLLVPLLYLRLSNLHRCSYMAYDMAGKPPNLALEQRSVPPLYYRTSAAQAVVLQRGATQGKEYDYQDWSSGVNA
uniref:Uncharacterized protein n=1 Tax=Oryza punctata TaxID=4537 RepID=A0A0E0KQ90_ORYPU